MPSLKKITAFVLLLLVALPLTGFILFYIQEKSIYAEMKRAFKTKELSTVHVKQIKWHEENKEIIIDGSLFDVSSISQLPDGSFLVKGLYDYQEKKLHQLLDQSTKKNKQSPLLILYASCFVSDQSDFACTLQQRGSLPDNIHGAYYETLIPQFQPGILLPPPKAQLFYS